MKYSIKAKRKPLQVPYLEGLEIAAGGLEPPTLGL